MTGVEEGAAKQQGVATVEARGMPRGGLRPFLSAVATLLIFASAAACAKSSATNKPSPSPTLSTVTVAMGSQVQTAAGNLVTVYSFLPSIRKAPGTNMVYAAADIKACGGPHATTVTGVQPALFDIEMQDKRAWRAVAAVKKPALGPALLQPNKCVRGWVTFIIPKTPKPAFVVLYSSALVKWKIPG
jgi:hypothetical protein